MDYIYICLFSNGHIKVGRSVDPQSRIAAHENRVACLGVSLQDHITFACENPAREAEAALIDFCQTKASDRFATEWFVGLDYAEVCTEAKRLALIDGTPDTLTEWALLVVQIQRHGLTQMDIAGRIGVGQPSINKVLSGRTKCPSFPLGMGLIQVALSLGIAEPSHLYPVK